MSASPPIDFHPPPLVSSTATASVRVKPGRHFPFLARHPWVHAHALIADSAKRSGEEMVAGDVVDLVDIDGNFLARGLVNPHSRLRIRLYSFDSNVEVNEDLLRQRIDAAIARRRLTTPFDPESAERLVFSEADLISGLIVDRYADCLGVQFAAGGLLRYRESILEHLRAVLDVRQIVVRVDEKTAKLEGLAAESASLAIADRPLDHPVRYRQNGLDLEVDLVGGQKTGGYLDQRSNHAAAAAYLHQRRVLDMCCYSGGFGLVAAQRGAASVIGIDSSAAALSAAEQSARRNGLEQLMTFRQGDCFETLKQLKQEGQQFDGVILDPPRFAGSRRQSDKAINAYHRLNSLAMDLLPRGGILVTCSCSGTVSRSDFMNTLADVGRRRRRDIILLENRGPAADHPLALACPESDYLKCLIAQVL